MSTHAGGQDRHDPQGIAAPPAASQQRHSDRCPFPRWLPDDQPLPAPAAAAFNRPVFTKHERAVIAAAVEHLARHRWPLWRAVEFIACTLGLPERMVRNLHDSARREKLKHASLQPYLTFLGEAHDDDGHAAFDRIDALLATLHVRSACR
jgi:hypothetical protein